MQYTTHTNWKRNATPFDVKSYDRTHDVRFDSGLNITASSAPEFLGNAELPNPEELFTASIASCFMLTFLYWAATKNLVVDEYTAEATGTLGKNAEGKMAMTDIVIKPIVTFHEGKQPEPALLADLFKKAHDNCFISNSVKTTVRVQSAQAVTA